ncbi:RidA family protein [Candidatus Formimonas warabiya]|uniref:RidA family protein n=1 Tax=Formimonas warabiya TaxID=1761012 RepID=UPI0011D16DC3|nr:RidA family protein [Candidatus Formimonas warabiya]
MSFEQKITELGLSIPEVAKPVAAYVPAVRVGDYVYTSGQIPFVNGELKYQGKVGSDVTAENGYDAAKICALNCLAAIKSVIGNLDAVERVIKIVGFVNSAGGFNQQPKVVNGASELVGQIFGAAGAHARSAVGVSELPLDAAVEVEMIVKIK